MGKLRGGWTPAVASTSSTVNLHDSGSSDGPSSIASNDTPEPGTPPPPRPLRSILWPKRPANDESDQDPPSDSDNSSSPITETPPTRKVNCIVLVVLRPNLVLESNVLNL